MMPFAPAHLAACDPLHLEYYILLPPMPQQGRLLRCLRVRLLFCWGNFGYSSVYSSEDFFNECIGYKQRVDCEYTALQATTANGIGGQTLHHACDSGVLSRIGGVI
eukprot:1115358-Amphidinium_carterae.1